MSLQLRSFRAAVLAGGCLLFASTNVAQCAPQRVAFDKEQEQKWTLQDLNPDLPSDWTGYNYLVLELKASSAQSFSLNLFSTNMTQRRSVHPLPNVWLRAAVPLQY